MQANAIIKSSTLDDAEITLEFKQKTLNLCELAATLNLKLVPFKDESLPYFCQLDSEQKKIVTERLATYLRICQASIEQGYPLDNSRILTWNALKEFGFTPSSDLMEKIKDTDVVEIYDENNIQIYRNFRFYSLCSYTVEDIYSRPWMELFVRDNEEVTKQLMSLTAEVFKKGVSNIAESTAGPQLLNEVGSVFNHTMSVNVKYLGALFSKDKTRVAMLGIEDAYLVNKLSASAEEEQLTRTFFAN